MKTVCKLAREVLDIAGEAIKVGTTADEIDELIHNECIKRNAYPSPLNYYNFPKSSCISFNEVVCHGIPDRRLFEQDDIVNIDVTLFYDGFHGDVNETYIIGNSEENFKLVNCAKECLNLAIQFVKPGARYRDIGDIIETYANSQNFSVVRNYCGHGVHELFHCAPDIPHYSKNKAIGIMRKNHVFTIEPMISQGVWQNKTWPDNWTVVTIDGKKSAQFEHTLLVTETGVEVLTK